MSMLKTYFNQVTEGLKKKLDLKVTARRKFIYEFSRIGARMFDPKWSIAWTTVFVPYEILNAMNVSGNFIEFVGAMLAGAGLGRPYFERAEAAGYSMDGCSYHRTIIGAAMEGILPKPDVLIGATFPCNGGIKALARIAEYYHKPTFNINVPYDSSPKSVDYLVKQYQELIKYVKAQTGRELDEDRLRNAIRLNNEGREYAVEALNLCKNVPSPASSNDWKNFIIYVLLQGTKEGIEVAKAYRDEFRAKIEQGIPGIPNEKHRLMWIQNRIQFKTDLIEQLEKNYGANVVIDELNHIWWEPMDERDPLRSLAIRQITHPLVGPIERRLKILTMLAKEFKVDGAVNPAHFGCRQSAGGRALFKEALQAVGVPLIHLDVDCVDERNYAEGQTIARLEAFMEML